MAYSVTKCDVGGSTTSGYHYEYLCESADDIADLPTGASSDEISRPAPGSLAFIESDSSARYILKISREWSEYPMAGSGGGGVLVVTVDEETAIADKTAAEVIEAVQAGRAVFFNTSMSGADSGDYLIALSYPLCQINYADGGYNFYGVCIENAASGTVAAIQGFAETLDDYVSFD